MFPKFLKRKTLSEDKLVNIFINTLLKHGDEAFELVVDYLNESSEFEHSPRLNPADTGKFYLVIITGNILKITKEIHDGSERRIVQMIISKLSEIFDMNPNKLGNEINACKKLISQLNYPSKNIVYGMSRALFHLYDLYPCQKKYFRDLKQPNPIVLKQLNEVMSFYIWDLKAYKEEFKVVMN